MSAEADEEIVRSAVLSAFEVGRSKDFGKLARLHADDVRFSKFSDTAPYSRQTAREASMYEEMAFANISDFKFSIENLKIDFFGDVAIATFIVEYRGILVDDYTFTGRTLNWKSRATMVFQKRRDAWLIIHEHLSKMPEQREG